MICTFHAHHRYAERAPPIDTDAQQLALVGRQIMHAWDTPNIQGWFRGRIAARGVSSSRDLRATPTANFVVSYDRSTTKNKQLHGRVASTLTPGKYGVHEWWLLLEPNSNVN